MDGTLLDLDFDNRFWRERVPNALSETYGVTLEEAKAHTHAAYSEMSGTLEWYDVEYWSAAFRLDLVKLQRAAAHEVALLPGVIEFLRFVGELGKPLHLVTNAHPLTLATKMGRCPILDHFDAVLSAFEVGRPKEDLLFWKDAERLLGFDPAVTVLVDDNTEALRAARNHGVAHVLYKARATLTGPPRYHDEFPSVEYFQDLMK